MINKKAFIFNTLTEALKYKISADPRNTTYRWGSFAPDAEIKEGEPDIPYYSEILIRETNQIWRCNQFWLNDVHRDPTTDLTTERAERIAGDEINRQLMSELEERHTEQMQELSDKVNRNICALEFDEEEGDLILVTSDASNITGGAMNDDGDVILDIQLT